MAFDDFFTFVLARTAVDVEEALLYASKLHETWVVRFFEPAVWRSGTASFKKNGLSLAQR